MTSISPGTNERKKGTVAEVFDESLTAELFNLLWGQERSAIPTVVDYAYEEIWKRVIMIGGSEEQRLSDVTLSEQLGMSRTPVRQALERLVQEGLVRSDPHCNMRASRSRRSCAATPRFFVSALCGDALAPCDSIRKELGETWNSSRKALLSG